MKQSMSALAMDLKRVAVGYYRGSNKMGDIFYQEAVKNINTTDYSLLPSYMQKKLNEIKRLSTEADKKKQAELALMYSIIVQNYCLKYC